MVNSCVCDGYPALTYPLSFFVTFFRFFSLLLLSSLFLLLIISIIIILRRRGKKKAKRYSASVSMMHPLKRLASQNSQKKKNMFHVLNQWQNNKKGLFSLCFPACVCVCWSASCGRIWDCDFCFLFFLCLYVCLWATTDWRRDKTREKVKKKEIKICFWSSSHVLWCKVWMCVCLLCVWSLVSSFWQKHWLFCHVLLCLCQKGDSGFLSIVC